MVETGWNIIQRFQRQCQQLALLLLVAHHSRRDWTYDWICLKNKKKDAIMRQIHPIFLCLHFRRKGSVQQSNFDKFLGFMRLCLEWFLNDIVVDAIIRSHVSGVWIVLYYRVLIVVTLMTNTTDKFIDLLNGSIFKAIGINTRIEKSLLSNGASSNTWHNKDANLKATQQYQIQTLITLQFQKHQMSPQQNLILLLGTDQQTSTHFRELVELV